MLSGKGLGVIRFANIDRNDDVNPQMGLAYDKFPNKRSAKIDPSYSDAKPQSQGIDPKLIFFPAVADNVPSEQNSVHDSDDCSDPIDWNIDEDPEPQFIGVPVHDALPKSETEIINESHIVDDLRSLTHELVMNRILDQVPDIERAIKRFAILVAGKWCATSASETESFYKEPTEASAAEKSKNLRGVLERLALKPVSETWEETSFENIDKLLNFSEGGSVSGKSFIASKYDSHHATPNSPDLIMRIGAPQDDNTANQSQFSRGGQQITSISSTNSRILQEIRNYLSAVRKDMRRLETDRASAGRTDKLFSQTDPSKISDRISYDVRYEIPKRESARDALSREGRKLAIEKFKTTNLTPSDMYLLRTFYPSLFPENNTRVATIWQVPEALEVVLSSISPRLQTPIEEAAIFINDRTNLNLQPYQLLLCRDLKCLHIFVGLCVALIKDNFNRTRASNVTAENAKSTKENIDDFSLKCRFIMFDAETLDFRFNTEGYKKAVINCRTKSVKVVYNMLGIHPRVIHKKFGATPR